MIYPVVIALLVGLSIDRPPGKPKVAFANLVPPGESDFSIGGRKLDVADYAPRLFSSVDAVRVDTREEAIEKVRSGEVLGAIVIPEDATDRLRRTLALSGGEPPTIEVYYNASDPLKQQLVETTINARLAEANDALSDAVLKEAAGYIDVIVTGGKVALPLVGSIDILGLRRSQAIIEAALESLPRDAPERVALEQVARFARLAADNLDVSKPILSTIGIAGGRQADQRQRVEDVAELVLRGRRRDGQPDVHHAPARGGPAGAGARGARVRPARPRACFT